MTEDITTPISIVNEDEPIRTVLGVFKDNQITTREGEVIECVTYNSVREKLDKFDGKEMFFNLIIYRGLKVWAIYQYVLIPDGMILE